jgi:uncharacterized repeat protein (TIGR03803 family)
MNVASGKRMQRSGSPLDQVTTKTKWSWRKAIAMSAAVASFALIETEATATGRETVLYTFLGGKDGAYPAAAVIEDGSGSIYGTTELGGGATACGSGGCGTVYKLTKANGHFTETVLYRFKGGTDGAYPTGRLLLDKSGDLFGTTVNGGSKNCTNGCGTVFELVPKTGGGYTKRTIHEFKNSPDGANPQAGLLEIGQGILLGTTTYGGSSGYGCYAPNNTNTCGTVFKLEPSGSGYRESIAYAFQPPPDASAPDTNLLVSGGSIFGAAVNGGTGGCVAPNYTCGSVFSLTPVGSGYSESVITLDGWNGDDGPNPIGGLASNSSGDLFGVALNAYSSNGDVFELIPGSNGYSQSAIHKFTGSPDGSRPESAPVVDKAGNVSGTTSQGGSSDCDCGIIYQLTPDGQSYTETVIWTFENGAGGRNPIGSLYETGGGAFIGAASAGGSAVNCNAGCGVIFEVTP